MLVAPSHESAVHAEASAHAAPVVQQPERTGWEHVPPGPLQTSSVQTFPSAQSAATLQQPAIATEEQPPGSTQESVVQRSTSLQDGAPAEPQTPAMQVSAPLHASASAQDVPSGRDASMGQVADAPLQASAMSQAPTAGRQTREDPSSAHVPFVGAPAAMLHAWQSGAEPPHALSQQTESTQWPEEHCAPEVHAPPCA